MNDTITEYRKTEFEGRPQPMYDHTRDRGKVHVTMHATDGKEKIKYRKCIKKSEYSLLEYPLHFYF